ncbi:MAG: hypothetical protein GXP49_13795 [Deltaproteobacteria bacterium]|nr:hypothetical protein [Deltaproteobacteria bacterium]
MAGYKGIGMIRRIKAGLGWSRTQTNTIIFRQQALVTCRNKQYLAYYDRNQKVVIGVRKHGESAFHIVRTNLEGDAGDAHKTICMGASPDGMLHLAFGLHDQPLLYYRTLKPGDPASFAPSMPLMKVRSSSATYPTFSNNQDNQLFFLWREGTSGAGDICLSRYDEKTETWRLLHSPLISGGHDYSPYFWYPGHGIDGSFHLAWCWRRTPDAGTNSMICHAVSRDGGKNWFTVSGRRLAPPITRTGCEVADAVPEGENLMNQGPVAVDPFGNPHIMYYRNDPDRFIRYVHLWNDAVAWRSTLLNYVKADFTLAGRGTLETPISRPNLVAARDMTLYALFRDSRGGGRIRIARATPPDYLDWQARTLLPDRVGQWEPCVDLALWNKNNIISLLVQLVSQGSHETSTFTDPTPITVVDFDPKQWWSRTSNQAIDEDIH